MFFRNFMKKGEIIKLKIYLRMGCAKPRKEIFTYLVKLLFSVFKIIL